MCEAHGFQAAHTCRKLSKYNGHPGQINDSQCQLPFYFSYSFIVVTKQQIC